MDFYTVEITIKTKQEVAKYTLIFYLNFNRYFDIHTYMSGTKLGSIIIKYNKPITSYNSKLPETQKRYTKMKKIISVV